MFNDPLEFSMNAETELAKETHQRLRRVNPLDIPVVSTKRSLDVVARLNAVRDLFGVLGIHGITAATGDFDGRIVVVTIPKRYDYLRTADGVIIPTCEAAVENRDARVRVFALLLAAFPYHEDRTSIARGVVDFCWVVN